MADYHPLIARAIDGLGTSTGEARRALYERARAALVAQLRGIDPPLSEADITRERLALEDAIRRVEADTVRRLRSEPRPAAPPLRPSPPAAKPQAAPPPPPPAPRERPSPPPAMSPRPEPPAFRNPLERPSGELTQASAASSARDQLLNARTSPTSRGGAATPTARDGLKGFRDVVADAEELGAASAKAAQSARDTRDSYRGSRQYAGDDEASQQRVEPRFHDDHADSLDDDAAQLRTLESDDDQEDGRQDFIPPRGRRPLQGEDHHEAPRPPRSYRGLAKLAVVLIVLAGLTATISWQWPNIAGIYHFFSRSGSHPTQTATGPSAEPKFAGRVPQDQTPGQVPGAGTAAQNQAGPAVAQRVVLYEEDSSDPQGKRYVGSAIWRTETVSPGTGLAPELQVRADITIPERNITVTFTLRRNTDQALPASHTIEIIFNLPPDFPGGGIANVPGVLMKESEQARGTPLAGLAVKVTNGFFLIGLSAGDSDVQRNIQLLKDRPWFDIPIVYNNGGRAILAIEKGPPGDRAFADAFAAWSK